MIVKSSNNENKFQILYLIFRKTFLCLESAVYLKPILLGVVTQLMLTHIHFEEQVWKFIQIGSVDYLL